MAQECYKKVRYNNLSETCIRNFCVKTTLCRHQENVEMGINDVDFQLSSILIFMWCHSVSIKKTIFW